MNQPKLKYPRLCRILTYVVVVGCAVVPCFIIYFLPFLSDGIKVLAMLGIMVALLVYLVKNFVVLMGMDMLLAILSCYRTARTRYPLPEDRTLERIKADLARFGTACVPSSILPQPVLLGYRFNSSLTVYTRGIERIVAAYEVDFLDADTYRAIFTSATANSGALRGKKPPFILDKQQKDAPLNRVTVAVIFAHRVDSKLSAGLYDLVCKQCGDDYDISVLPCVIDLETRTCVFNSLRAPYVGFGYPVKNRGIRLIRQKVFGGRLPLTKENQIPPIEDVDPQSSLWELWGELRRELIQDTKADMKRFEAMADKEMRMDEDTLYLKWGEHGICLYAELDAEKKTASVETVGMWSYPKERPIAKKTIAEIEEYIRLYFRKQGYTPEFDD